MKIVCISDTHALHRKMTHEIPECDILIHAGDLTNRGSVQDVIDFNDWIKDQPAKHKVVIAGNHDFFFERMPRTAIDKPCIDSICTNFIYLHDETVEIEGLKIYGSPYQPRFFDWAFNVNRGKDLEEIWSKIPEDTDILITHGPPNGILDEVDNRWSPNNGEHVGCEELIKVVKRIKPKAHIFGHIHSEHGFHEEDETKFVNASICTEKYEPSYEPIVIEV